MLADNVEHVITYYAAYRRFLEHNQKFTGNFKNTETGGVRLISPKQARLGWLYVAPSSSRRDPNRNRDGCYYVAAVNLIHKCKNYPPFGILVYLPFEEILFRNRNR